MKLEPLTFSLRIHPEQIADLIACAGITHWCSSMTATEFRVPGVPERQWPQYQSSVGGNIAFKVSGGRTYYLNQEAAQRAIQIIADKYSEHLPGLVNSEKRDARTGDVFIQCALFGEIRYFRWPVLMPVEETRRIAYLKLVLEGKDVTVQPWSALRDELEWRRTDSKITGARP